MKLFIYVFAIVLLHALAMPTEDRDDEIDRAEIRDVAVKAAKFKKAFTEFHDVLVKHPQVLDDLSKAVPAPAKTMKTAGGQTQKDKKINKKFFGFITNLIGSIFG
uniref:Uncharacterized protein n=1 Tax=Panagrolaimus sp. ES5 TaxID=591445 RepID=A0AC34FA72_9BILA